MGYSEHTPVEQKRHNQWRLLHHQNPSQTLMLFALPFSSLCHGFLLRQHILIMYYMSLHRHNLQNEKLYLKNLCVSQTLAYFFVQHRQSGFCIGPKNQHHLPTGEPLKISSAYKRRAVGVEMRLFQHFLRYENERFE